MSESKTYSKAESKRRFDAALRGAKLAGNVTRAELKPGKASAKRKKQKAKRRAAAVQDSS